MEKYLVERRWGQGDGDWDGSIVQGRDDLTWTRVQWCRWGGSGKYIEKCPESSSLKWD
jgi:hypothetical protein